MWRFDKEWKDLRRLVPWVKRASSEYIREHVYLTTQPVEEPHRLQQFGQMPEHFGDMASNILFASDYPHRDSDDPEFALPSILSEDVLQAIQYDNAKKLYNL